MAIKVCFSELVVLKIYRKSNLWQFLLQYCGLQDSNLNENELRQRGLDKKFQEILKLNLKLLKKNSPEDF